MSFNLYSGSASYNGGNNLLTHNLGSPDLDIQGLPVSNPLFSVGAQEQITFKICTNIASMDARGYLFVSGADIFGLALYLADGKIVFECGVGVGTGPTGINKSERGYCETPIVLGDHCIEFTADGPVGDAQLWVDGVMVSRDQAWSAARASGIDPARVGARGPDGDSDEVRETAFGVNADEPLFDFTPQSAEVWRALYINS